MFNLRYHIASLVGVFLALALGLVLGGLVVQQGTVDEQQNALVAGLQKEFSTLRSENRELASENQLLNAYSKRVTDAWAADRLKGRTIVVITNAGREIGTQAAIDAIESAGGSVAKVTILVPALGMEDEAIRSRLASIAGDADDVLASIATSLAAEWTSPAANRPVTEALVAAEVLRVDGFGPGVMATGLVDVATADGEADESGIALAEAFSKGGAAVVAQLEGTDTGLAAAVRSAAVSAFDTLGSEAGRYTLVALMTGAAPGRYGSGEGAGGLFPAE